MPFNAALLFGAITEEDLNKVVDLEFYNRMNKVNSRLLEELLDKADTLALAVYKKTDNIGAARKDFLSSLLKGSWGGALANEVVRGVERAMVTARDEVLGRSK